MGGKTSTASKTKYNAKTYERLVLNLRVDSLQSKKAIEAAAEDAGVSATAYVVEAVRRRMEQEQTPGGVVKNPESAPLMEEKPSCSISPSLKRAIKKTVQDAVQNFSEEEYDKLRYEFDKLIYETFAEESRKPKRSISSTPDESKKDENKEKVTGECICESLL